MFYFPWEIDFIDTGLDARGLDPVTETANFVNQDTLSSFAVSTVLSQVSSSINMPSASRLVRVSCSISPTGLDARGLEIVREIDKAVDFDGDGDIATAASRGLF